MAKITQNTVTGFLLKWSLKFFSLNDKSIISVNDYAKFKREDRDID